MEPSVRQIIERVLVEHDVDAESMLEAMVGALVERHIDVELRRLGRREPYPIHNERADALKAVNDALHQAHARVDPKKETQEEAVVRAVMAVLMHCQFAAEKAAGIGGDGGDGDDEGPRMRLVRE